jgi:hypothetical protein
MPRRNRTSTVRVPLSLDPAKDRVLEQLARLGLFGKNKAEVASTILAQWIWDNEEKLRRHGIRLRSFKKFLKGNLFTGKAK